MSQLSALPLKPPPELIDLYRAAAAAYRAAYRAGGFDYESRCAGRDAVKQLRPGLSDEEAMLIADRATVYAAAHHPAWFWKRA
jgi:hypothetical protein